MNKITQVQFVSDVLPFWRRKINCLVLCKLLFHPPCQLRSRTQLEFVEMFSASSYSQSHLGQDTSAFDRNRSQLSHSSSQYDSPFSTSGSGSSSQHAHDSSNWNPQSSTNTLTSSINDNFHQSRSHYQPGYLMVRCFKVIWDVKVHHIPQSSTSQNNVWTPFYHDRRLDSNLDSLVSGISPASALWWLARGSNEGQIESRAVQGTYSRVWEGSYVWEFTVSVLILTDSWTECWYLSEPRQRPTLDEDAPPTTSVNDIVNATYMDHSVGNQRKVRVPVFNSVITSTRQF